MSNKVIYAMYNDDDVLKKGASELVEKGVHINDVFSPFPIHGIDPIIGVKETNIGYAAFIYGLTGLSLALFGMWFFMIYDWPMNIGGKPSMEFVYNLPSFIPISFEFTVLLTGHGMALTYFIKNQTFPGVKAHNPDPRTTDDKFVMEIMTGQNSKFSQDELNAMLKETGLIELSEKDL